MSQPMRRTSFQSINVYSDPRGDFLRPPDWRWQLSRIDRKASGDAWGDRLLEFRRRPDESSVNDIARANALFDGDPLRHAEIEARILANVSVEDIASKCQLSTATVVAYEAVFFDARRRLQASAWIRTHLLRSWLRTTDVGDLWRVFSYHFGLRILELLLDGADRNRLLKIGMSAYSEPECQLSPALKTLITDIDTPFPSTLAELEMFLARGEI